MRLLAHLLFLVVGIAVYGTLRRHLPGDDYILARIAVVLGLSFVSTLVHELGHAAAVQMVGGRIRSIVALPLALQMEPRRLRLIWRTKGREVGGYVSYEINRIQARRRHVIVAAAGPVASLALSLAAAIAARLAGSDTMIWDVLTALCLLSGGVGLANLLPFSGSDGSHIVRGLRGAG